MSKEAAYKVLSGSHNKKELNYDRQILKDQSKLISFYLPQFHRIKENSEWWGTGFTEWTNVAQGKPNFQDHYQPHIPRELGFYDLSHIDIMYEQAEMAKLYGIYGFCFYYYWFSGRRILETPLRNFLKSDIDLNFCLCWANENWTRTWDGEHQNILLEQKYLKTDPKAFIDSLIDYFKDKRYIYIDEKPVLIVYRAKEIPNPQKTFEAWRKRARQYGFSGLYIIVVDFYDISHPDEVDADAMVEFPPHKFNGPQNQPDQIPEFSNTHFSGGIIDYVKIISQSLNRPPPPFKLYRSLMPGWDNTARRQNTPTITVNVNPEYYGEWLKYLRAYTRHYLGSKPDNFIFINAWNEWGEGCHLEPDLKWGLGYLEQTLASSYYTHSEEKVGTIRKSVFETLSKTKQTQSNQNQHSNTQAELYQTLSNHKTPTSLVQKIAWSLRHQPLLYKSARFIYRTVIRLGK